MPSLANVTKVRVCSICTKKIKEGAIECEDGHPVGRPSKEDSYFIEVPLEPQLNMVIEGEILAILNGQKLSLFNDINNIIASPTCQF